MGSQSKSGPGKATQKPSKPVSGRTLTSRRETMMRLLTGALLSLAAGMIAVGQSKSISMSADKADSEKINGWDLDKAQVLRVIALNEAEIRENATRADRKRLVLLYSNLGVLYLNAGMYLKADDVIHRAIALLKDGPEDQLANETGQLALLQMAMGNMREAEKDEKRTLQIREALADPVGIALTQGDLAGVYNAERKFTKALGYAEKAYDVVAGRTDVSAANRIGVLQALGYALTVTRDCDRGTKILKDALHLTHSNLGAGTNSMGYSEFLLGFGYWQCGDREAASEWMKRGTTDLSSSYGMGHAAYLGAMTQYARFLGESGQPEAAMSAEAVVHAAESVVDASTLTGRTEVFQSAPSR
jgi:tetratricopeptide (TPR) repeat protein